MKNYLSGFKIKHFRFTYLVFALILAYGFYLVYSSSVRYLDCANSISCIKDLSGRYEKERTEGVFLGKKVKVPQYIVQSNSFPSVLGTNNPSNKHIYVDLTNQRLYAFEGDKLVHNFLISSGKWGRTPTGDFKIWVKLRATLMSGGNKALGTYYYLPNVPYTMYFYNEEIPKTRGYALHGAYWHNNFGHPMSHGCVNIRPDQARDLYLWANPQPGNDENGSIYPTEDDPSTPVTIYGTAPAE